MEHRPSHVPTHQAIQHHRHGQTDANAPRENRDRGQHRDQDVRGPPGEPTGHVRGDQHPHDKRQKQDVAHRVVGERDDPRRRAKQQQKQHWGHDVLSRQRALAETRKAERHDGDESDVDALEPHDVIGKAWRHLPDHREQQAVHRRILRLKWFTRNAGDRILTVLDERLGSRGIHTVVVKQAKDVRGLCPKHGSRHTDRDGDPRPELETGGCHVAAIVYLMTKRPIVVVVPPIEAHVTPSQTRSISVGLSSEIRLRWCFAWGFPGT